ncbi:MAG: hypothetical protein K6G61_06375 [Solobacterium sp.]|nr:hypothetical protein [Solobacterium sp.]
MKRPVIAALSALLITLAGMYINYRSFLDTHYLKWSLKMHGGEITAENGFGLRVSHIYAMTPETSDSHSLGFSPVSFLVTFLVIAAAVILVLSITEKISHRSIERR